MAGLVEVSDVTREFASGRSRLTALKGLSFDVADGEFLVIVGPSGCGKSTMLRMLAGVTSPTSGTVTIGGENPMQSPVPIGMVFQTPVLLPWRSVLANVLLPIEVARQKRARFVERAHRLLELVGLEGFGGHRPYQLSGGMEQRVALCRALINDPILLLADEPFGALDALTRERLNLELQRVWTATSKTVVMVTHSIVEAVFLASRVLVMSSRPGRITDQVRIDLPRPRDLAIQDTAEFVAYTRQVRQALEATEDPGEKRA